MKNKIKRKNSTLSPLVLRSRWTKKTQILLIITLVIVFGGLSIPWIDPREVCKNRGGEWIQDGIFGQAHYCLYSYSDAGKPCQSSKDCLGACIVEDYSMDNVPETGVCAPDNRKFGCFNYFENQQIGTMCVD